MALVTGIPNFNSETEYSASSVDTANTSIVTQVGGVSFSSGTPTVANGNLEVANFASDTGLSNSHKAEPYSWQVLNVHMSTFANRWAFHPGPAQRMHVRYITMSFGGESTGGISATGTFDIVTGLQHLTFAVTGLKLGKGEIIAAGFDLFPGQFLQFDLGDIVLSTGNVTNITIHLWGVSAHTS